MSRMPAPVKVLVVPARWALRKRRIQTVARREVAKSQKQMLDAIERRLGPEPASIEATPAAPAAEAAPAPAASRLDTAKGWAYRHRRDVLAPFAVAVALAVVRDVVHRFPAGWSWLSLAVAVLPMAVVLGAGIWWQAQIDSSTPQGHGRRLATRWTIVLGLLWAACPLGFPVPTWPHHITLIPDLPAALPGLRWLALLAGAIVAAQMRWRRFQPRAEEPPRRAGNADIWNEHLSSQGTTKDFYAPPRKETRIIDGKRGDVGWQIAVQAPPNTEGTIAVSGARNRIATTYRVRPEWIEVVHTDSLADCFVRVVETATLARSRPFLPGGVDLAAGTVEVGTYPDGSRSKIQAWAPGRGAKHIWFAGSTGSGKTGAASCYLGRVMQTGLVVLDLVDMGETSLPAWVDVAYRFGTTVEQGVAALRRAVAVMEARQAAMRTEKWTDRDGVEHIGRSTLTPSQKWPLYCLTVEEWPELLDEKEAVAMADRLGRLGRKYAVQLVLISQAATLKEAFGNAGILRTNITKGGNAMIFSGEKDSARMAFGGTLKVDPSSIPLDNPGLGFIASPANYRDALHRVDWIDDDDARPANVPSSWQVASLAVPGTLNPVDEAAIRELEEQMARDSEEPAQLQLVGSQTASTRELAEAAVLQLSAKKGGVVTTGEIVAALGDPTDNRLYDRVSKALGALNDDPQSPVNRQSFGKWAA